MRLTFQPFRSKHTFTESGTRHHAGDTFEVSPERGAYLLEQHGDVLVADDPEQLGKLKRPELDELARERGVLSPELLDNKTAVIAAIENAD